VWRSVFWLNRRALTTPILILNLCIPLHSERPHHRAPRPLGVWGRNISAGHFKRGFEPRGFAGFATRNAASHHGHVSNALDWALTRSDSPFCEDASREAGAGHISYCEDILHIASNDETVSGLQPFLALKRRSIAIYNDALSRFSKSWRPYSRQLKKQCCRKFLSEREQVRLLRSLQ